MEYLCTIQWDGGNLGPLRIPKMCVVPRKYKVNREVQDLLRLANACRVNFEQDSKLVVSEAH